MYTRMDIQLFAVIVIGIVVGVLLFRGIYRFFFAKKKGGYCGGCTLCELPGKKGAREAGSRSS